MPQEKHAQNTPDFVARLMAVQALYAQVQTNESIRQIIEDFLAPGRVARNVDGEDIGKPNPTLFRKILIASQDREADISQILEGHLRPEKQVEPILKAILSCGAAEILSHAELDAALIINDYLNVTHAFYDQPQVSFVNGVLDSVAKKLRT